MSRIFARIAGIFTSKNFVGADKAGNRYFTKQEQVDGILKVKRWVIFKGEDDPTSIPVEWICWLNGQRKTAPTPEEMMELEARREQVKLNVALLKKEEEQRAKAGGMRRGKSIGKVGGPDLKSFIRQFPEGAKEEETQDADGGAGFCKETEADKEPLPESSEPTGSGSSFRPGTWQPPT